MVLLNFFNIQLLDISGYFICDDILKDGKSGLFGVFDGHGGRDVVDYLIKNFTKANY